MRLMKSMPSLSSTLHRIGAIGSIFALLAAADPALAALSQAQRDLYSARLADNARGRFTTTTLSPLLPASDAVRLAEAVVQWDRLRRDEYPASFQEITGFLRQYPGWPAETTLRRRAEAVLTPATPMAERLAFFSQYPPLTGSAMIRHAEALLASGRTVEGQALIRRAWRSSVLTPTLETDLMSRHAAWFTPADHVARADMLLWQGAISPTLRLIPLLPAPQQALVQARIAFRQKATNADARLAAVPSDLRQDAGLIYDRAQAMRDSNISGARTLLADSRIAPGEVSNPVAWLKLRVEIGRAALREGQADIAYRIVANHNALPMGRLLSERPFAERQAYSDAEWLAGWAALTALDQPARALRHFQNFSAAVLTPVSLSRGDYWAGRAAEAAGMTADARRYFMRAGTHPDQFYGQLALERLGQPITLPSVRPPLVSAAERARFDADDLVQATILLDALGDSAREGMFIRALVARAESPTQKKLIADLASRIGRPELGVLAGIAARNNGEFALLDTAFPRLPLSDKAQDNWTMVHAITRQESRFDRTAISHAGARGLMQLMPGTAREQAGKLGQSYDFDRLTRDPDYNILLGSTYYQRMLAAWGGNHVLAVASYNAGAGNVRRWIRANGDPRDPSVDVLEWIESIPIYETRNYVQRVLENAVVYDLLHPGQPAMPSQNRLSAYLGKRRPG